MFMHTRPTNGTRFPCTSAVPAPESPRGTPSAYPIGSTPIREARKVDRVSDGVARFGRRPDAVGCDPYANQVEPQRRKEHRRGRRRRVADDVMFAQQRFDRRYRGPERLELAEREGRF
jgi:hypothetical protein